MTLAKTAHMHAAPQDSMANSLLVGDLFALQVEQFAHDEQYHREIARLPVGDRLKHMALHFAKYVGYISTALAADVANRREMAPVVIDTFIIGLSTANIINLRLDEALGEYDLLRRSSQNEFFFEFAKLAGEFAKACETLDHVEDYPSRREMQRIAPLIAQACIHYANASGLDLVNEVRVRLKAVKHKSIFFGQ